RATERGDRGVRRERDRAGPGGGRDRIERAGSAGPGPIERQRLVAHGHRVEDLQGGSRGDRRTGRRRSVRGAQGRAVVDDHQISGDRQRAREAVRSVELDVPATGLDHIVRAANDAGPLQLVAADEVDSDVGAEGHVEVEGVDLRSGCAGAGDAAAEKRDRVPSERIAVCVEGDRVEGGARREVVVVGQRGGRDSARKDEIVAGYGKHVPVGGGRPVRVGAEPRPRSRGGGERRHGEEGQTERGTEHQSAHGTPSPSTPRTGNCLECTNPRRDAQPSSAGGSVRSPARFSFRSMARRISSSRSRGSGRPLASQSLGYIEIAVKPGSVLISLTRTRSVPRSRKKSTRAIPDTPHSRKTSTARRLATCATASETGAGISSFALSSRYLSS